MWTKWLLCKLLFAGTMFFAAGADAMAGIADGGGEGSSDGGDDASGGDSGLPSGDDGIVSQGDGAHVDGETDGEPRPDAGRSAQPTEEKEVTEFKGLVSKRMLDFQKEAPELAEIFAKHPGLQEKFEAPLRRDLAFRECFATVAEARQMRELFPAGLKDVEVLQGDARELQELDSLFDSRGNDGSYPGHKDVIANMFGRDKAAAVSFCRTFPKEWARLDPESYNDVNGKMVGATLGALQVSDMPMLDFLATLHESAKEAKQDNLANGLARIWNKLNGYVGAKENARMTPEQEDIARQRKELDQQNQSRTTQEFNRFRDDYNTKSMSLTKGIIEKNPAVEATLKSKAVPDAKKQSIVMAIHAEIGNHLRNSPSFMRQLQPLYKAGKLQEALQLQKSAWSNPALLNRIVRQVLAKETPNLVNQNRESAQRRSGALPARVPVKTAEQSQRPTKPYKDGKNWMNADGTQMTAEDIMRGKHLAS